ncbi:hypothetical protein G9A89_021389 [Geosiphon pyriformis]|nr:hypothetical protein G9A89_021389 [Geosiphon pyriformis]
MFCKARPFFRRAVQTMAESKLKAFEEKDAASVKGLYEFFIDGKKALASLEDLKVGRSWRAAELRKKGFEDLHKLWYILLKERNLLATMKQEAKRFNKYEDLWAEAFQKRNLKCVKAMARIKFVLSERRHCFEYAKQSDLEYFNFRSNKEREEKRLKEPEPIVIHPQVPRRPLSRRERNQKRIAEEKSNKENMWKNGIYPWTKPSPKYKGGFRLYKK